jgi:cell division protein FtsI (penicillin-binding protein 3)
VTRTYSPTRRIASFVGFLPLSNPRLSILVVIDEPQTSPYGGVVAAPVFRNIAEQSLRYLHVPPEVTSPGRKEVLTVQNGAEKRSVVAEPAEVALAEGGEITGEGLLMPEFRGMTMRQVLKVMERQGVNVRIIGTGRVIQQNPLPGQPIAPDTQVWVKLAPSA